MSKLLVLLIFICLQANSDEPALFESRMKTDSAAFGVSMNSVGISYRSNRRNIMWPHAYNRINAYDFGISANTYSGRMEEKKFSGFSFKTLFGRKFSSSNYSEVLLGLNLLDDYTKTGDESNALIIGDFLHVIRSGDEIYILRFNRDYVYTRLFLPAGVEHRLVENRMQIEMRKNFEQYFVVNITAGMNWLSDNNRIDSYTASGDFNFYINRFQVWVGTAGEYIENRFMTDRYSSLPFSYAVGPRIGISYVPYDSINLTYGYDLSYGKDSDKINTRNEYRYLQMDLGDRNNVELSLSYVQMRSYNLYETWFDNQASIRLKYSL